VVIKKFIKGNALSDKRHHLHAGFAVALTKIPQSRDCKIRVLLKRDHRKAPTTMLENTAVKAAINITAYQGCMIPHT
jgi:hypothetical protein